MQHCAMTVYLPLKMAMFPCACDGFCFHLYTHHMCCVTPTLCLFSDTLDTIALITNTACIIWTFY